MKHQSDSLHIQQVLNGNTNAFSHLVEKYKDMAYTIALRITRNHEDAEEIAQDSFLKAYQNLAGFHQESKFSTWLYRIVYNTAVSRTRKKQVATDDINDVEMENISADAVYNQIHDLRDEDQKKYIRQAINRLSEDESLLITLYYLNESSIEEINQVTGLTKSNIKVKLHRARKKLYVVLNILLKEEIKELL